MKDPLFADLETFSECDLKRCGSYRYAEDPSTEVLLFPYAIGDRSVYCWDLTDGSPMPRDLFKALRDVRNGKRKIVMHNGLLFDRLILREAMGIIIKPEQMHDTMIQAFRHALPGKLETLCEVFNLDASTAKDKAGKALIKRFSKPTPKNYKIRRYDSSTHPDEWAAFIVYAKKDISSMRALYYKMPSWGETDFENRILALDQTINDRGFYVDFELANAAIKAVLSARDGLINDAKALYGSGLTGADFLPTLRELAPAHTVLNAQKATLTGLLDDEDLPDEARAIIEMRLGAASTASTKYHPLLLGSSADGRRRGCVQYGGAKRTLRWAGKGFQPQNLARGFFKGDQLSRGIKALRKGNAHLAYDVMKLAATTVRSCIIPALGHKLVVADYSNVEGRGLAWLAGETVALTTFRSGLDIYKVTAGKMFGVAPETIDDYRRQIGKVCELGLGYGGGVAAFLQFAKVYGLDLVDMAATMAGTFPDHIWAAARKGFEFARIQEAKKKDIPGKKVDRPSFDLPKKVWLTCDSIKRMWREAHPETCKFWWDLEEAALSAINNPGQSFWAGARVRPNGKNAIRIERTVTSSGKPGKWLKVELPSGRIMSYPNIAVSMVREEVSPAWDEVITRTDGTKVIKVHAAKTTTKARIKYKGESQTTRQWLDQYTYGGKLAENITQALCRDVLAYSMPVVEGAGYPIILSVHDELLTEVPDTDDYSVKELEELMCTLPIWAKGFPLAAEGWEGYRYKK